MDNRLLATIIIFPIWLTLVLIFRKHRQWLLYYLIAAFGLTIQVVFLAEHFGWDQQLVNLASFHVYLISKVFLHIPMELLTNGRFQIMMPDGTNSILKLGIECSAILESSVILGLIIFYPLFNVGQKILRVTFGLIVTYAINIVRLMIIVLMAYKFGSDYIFIAHAGVARIFFFVCELLLYWYLMTKPSVKAVGQSIKEKIPVSQAAALGRTFKTRYAITQLSVIIIFAILVSSSFVVSSDWQKAFTPNVKQERPIIYQEETTLTPVPETSSSLYQELALDLLGGQKNQFKFNIQKEEEINVQVLEGQQDLAARIILNGENVELVTLPRWLFNKQQSIFEPLTVKPGDVLEVKFQNLAEKEPSQYLVKIYPKGMQDLQICTRETLPSGPTSQSQPKPEPPSQVQSSQPVKSVAGDSSPSLYQELALDLLGGQKNQFKFNIQKEEEINVQVLEGQQDLAVRLLINGVDIAFVSFAPWRFDKYTSIFEPIKVKPGDVLELRFQNLAEDEPAQYLIKVYPSGDEDV